MRILVDLDEEAIAALDEMAAAAKQSRAALLRKVVAEHLRASRPQPSEAFGLWGKRKVDGLAYQKKARAEW